MAASALPVIREFELLVLLAVLSLGEAAYPLAIGDAIEKRINRRASRAAVLITLERLEDKGFLTSRYGDPTPVRGGRAKRFFRPKPAAIQAVKESLHGINTMAAGLESLLKPR
jgi:PadR family transcriptional regulator, regulatory protein PadR